MSGSVSVARAVAWRGLKNTYSNPALFLPSIIFPLFFYVAFAGGLSSVGNAPGFDYPAGYDTFQFGFVLLQASAFGGVFTGFAVAADFQFGFARRLMLAAPRREALVVGWALIALGRITVTLTFVTAVALATGMRPRAGLTDVLGLIALAALVALAATLFAAGVAMRLKSLQAGPLMQMPVFLTIFLAPVFVPLDLVSGWVHGVATVNPATALMQGGRSLLAGTDVDVLLTYGVALGLVALFAVWSLRSLRRAEQTGA